MRLFVRAHLPTQEVRTVNGVMHAARKAADSSALAIPRERLCDAICNVLAVLALHLQQVLPEEHLSALPPPPRSLQQRVRYLPPHMQTSASAVSTHEWIETLFETVVLDNWCAPVAHATTSAGLRLAMYAGSRAGGVSLAGRRLWARAASVLHANRM